jgi:hypothetical protein
MELSEFFRYLSATAANDDAILKPWAHRWARASGEAE